MKTIFSTHALCRIESRLLLSKEKVADILDSNRFCLIGKDSKSNIAHRLFYSEPDGQYFVAIQDEENGEVVTILPADFHRGWEISPDALRLARELILGKPEEAVINVRRNRLRIKAYVLKTDGLWCLVSVGSVSIRNYSTIHEALADPEVHGRITQSLEERKPRGSRVLEIFYFDDESKKITISL